MVLIYRICRLNSERRELVGDRRYDSKLMQNMTVVIRAVDERTLAICHKLLENLCGEMNIFTVQNITPFSEAVKKSFLLGIRNKKKWTLIVDADVLISEKEVGYLVNIGEFLLDKDKNFFFLNGMLYDKFWMENRVCGLHLYKTAVLPKALHYIIESNKSLRPETFIKEKMQKHGYNSYICNLCVGVHDFFQSYKSILRKGMLHAKKHKQIENFYKKWDKIRDGDKDFEWMCKGIELGRELEDIRVDYNYFSEIIEEKGFEFQQQEEVSLENVSDVLKKYVIPDNKIFIYRPMSLENKIRRQLGKPERKKEFILENFKENRDEQGKK